MIRFIITVLVGTVLHALACIIIPPFEFAPTRLACFFWALRSGIVVFPIVFAVLLLPLRAGLRRFMPQSTQQTHAVMAALKLFVVIAAWILARQISSVPSPPYEHGYLCQWIFWPVFVVIIVISFFWPFGTRTTPPNTALEPTPTALEFMDGLSCTTVIEIAEPFAGRRGSALDR